MPGSSGRRGLSHVRMVLDAAWVLALAAMLAPATAWAVSPHLTFSGGDTCGICHVPHQAATSTGLFRSFGATAGELPVCYECHDGSGSSTDIRTGPDSFGGASGHVLEGLVDTSTPTDLTNACSSCHRPHGDYAARPKLPAGEVNGVAVTAPGNAWCLACHNDAQAWFARKGTYPPLSSPSRDASGYPKTGTFPGASVYASGTANAHIRIDASSGATTRTAGDCLYCHAAHGSAARYDALTAAFAPSTPASVVSDRATGAYAALCFACHAGGSWETSGAPNIKRYVTFGAADTGIGASGGHRIKSAGGTLPVNAPLPCYDCHNPHGSSRGNKKLLSDALGGSLDTSSAAAVRRFCLTCHTTSDGLGWDSSAAAYAAPSAEATIEGLPRLGGSNGSGPDGGKNWLRLRAASGHMSTDTTLSCYDCHGDSYASAASNNVHDPATYTAASHTGNPSSATITILGTIYGPYACSGCHNVELGPEHAKATSSNNTAACAECHPNPRSTLTPWNKATCAQGGCHTAGSAAPLHGGVDAAHQAPANGCTATGCHFFAGMNLAVIHRDATTTTVNAELRTSCEVCHADGVPATSDCSTCHVDPHGNDTAIHTGDPGSADIPMTVAPYDSDHGSGWTATDVACVTCHSANLLVQHAYNCAVCHAGAAPRGSFGAWNGTCQQGACHPAIHTGMTTDHCGAYWNSSASCDSCHENSSPWPGPASCDPSCHGSAIPARD